MKNKFPSISRSFTEYFNLNSGFKSENREKAFLGFVVFSSFALLIVVTILFIVLAKMLRDQQLLKEKTQKLNKEVIFWQNVVVEKPDYRDAFFELSLLEYELKDLNQAKFYLQKALALDPNFKKGIEFKSRIE